MICLYKHSHNSTPHWAADHPCQCGNFSDFAALRVAVQDILQALPLWLLRSWSTHTNTRTFEHVISKVTRVVHRCWRMPLGRILALISIYNHVSLKTPKFTIPYVKFKGFNLKPQQSRHPYNCPLINNILSYGNTIRKYIYILSAHQNHLPSCNVASVIDVILQARKNFCTSAKIITLTIRSYAMPRRCQLVNKYRRFEES